MGIGIDGKRLPAEKLYGNGTLIRSAALVAFYKRKRGGHKNLHKFDCKTVDKIVKYE